MNKLNNEEIKKMNSKANQAFHGAVVIDYSPVYANSKNSYLVLIKRKKSIGENRQYLLSNYNVTLNNFNSSEYYLTLESAVNLYTKINSITNQGGHKMKTDNEANEIIQEMKSALIDALKTNDQTMIFLLNSQIENADGFYI
tara:strand:- start:591 stop:1016 length:426 start_codon:yes stop_codon:yes gene_type:complete